MTSDDLWRDVGRHLRDVRERQGKKWLHLATDARAKFKAKLDPKTIQAIERGEPGQIDKLELLAQILGLSIVDVLSSVLKAAEQRPTPEAAALLRCFEHLGVVDRRLLLESAQRLLEQHEARTRLGVTGCSRRSHATTSARSAADTAANKVSSSRWSVDSPAITARSPGKCQHVRPSRRKTTR